MKYTQNLLSKQKTNLESELKIIENEICDLRSNLNFKKEQVRNIKKSIHELEDSLLIFEVKKIGH